MRNQLLLAVLVIGSIGVKAAPLPFDYEVLTAEAKALGAAPYRPQESRVPQWLRSLDYDHYRDIRFRPPESWWNHNSVPFKLQFFHPGSIYTHTVQLYELDQGRPKPIPFSARFFDYGNNKTGPIPRDLGFAGFRIHYPLNLPGDELGVYEGASYFRFLCRRASYGLSARGLAINVASDGPEEFPNFEKFWIQTPSGPQATELIVYALLDSPSVAGAYRFNIVPGDDTVVHVRSTLFFRKNPEIPGIAPLTSMFWHGKTTNFATNDIRPEVHDSDGLMMHTGAGEWFWRPLTNFRGTRTMVFVDENPHGFGLMQRERRYEAYDDMEAQYQFRPSCWVEPINHWGPGEVRLVTLDAQGETQDNVVAFWKPASLPRPGVGVDFEYNLHWGMNQIRPPLGYCVSTKHGQAGYYEAGVEHFIVDFDGIALQKMGPEMRITPVVSVGDGGALVHYHAEKNRYNGQWRVAFGVKSDGTQRPIEMRCYLMHGSDVMSETWSYLWVP